MTADRVWFACFEPERPPDPLIVWHYTYNGSACVGCQVKADAVRRAWPDDVHVAWFVAQVGRP